MKYVLMFCFSFVLVNAQVINDDFEGSGTITSWYGDDCNLNTSKPNPYQETINTSATVLEYHDVGGQYANVRFDSSTNFDLMTKNSFRLKIYIPSSGVSGSQNNQVALKLQNNTLTEPWTTQTEIIKNVTLNGWQDVVFNFETDGYTNYDTNSPAPISRTDLNRVLIQVNGENNNDAVIAYIDDVDYFQPVSTDPVYDYLVWSDEFNGTGVLDNTKWFHQTQLPAGGSWYNGEIQHYTDRSVNSSMYGGNLHLVAKKETYTDQGQTKQYTSARLNSKYAFTYGKVEIRAQLPTGVGTWPALWMLGKNITETGAYWQTQGFGTTGWPACGEIDIMEHWGHNQDYVQSAMHTPSSSGATVNHGGQVISNASTTFHIYTLEWYPTKMVFKVDGVHHYTYEPSVYDNSTWPYYADQYLLFNIAIQPSITSSFTQSSMIVDYVRVYQENPLSVDDLQPKTNVSFYPNPVNNTLNINFDNASSQNITLDVVDLNGRVVATKTYNSAANLTYDTSSLSSGVYISKLRFDDGASEHFKFIKQ